MSTIKLMNMEKFSKLYKEVTSSDIFASKGGSYHPNGLFSEDIFGAVETMDRSKNFAFINLNTYIIHPSLIPILKRLEKKIISAINREAIYSIDKEGMLVEDPEGEITGIKSIYENIHKIKFRGGTPQRENLIKMIYHYIKTNLFFMNKCPVMPPTFRDGEKDDDGKFSMDELNDYYLVIIKKSLYLKTNQEGIAFDILSINMQQSMVDLYEFVSSKLSKKEGLIRHDILGKRVDYSARAVIAGAGNELKSDELGIPLRAMVKLFEPFILHELINGKMINKDEFAEEMYAYNKMELSISSARALLNGIYNDDEIPNSLETIIRIAVNRAIEGKVVIAKRDPALHTESSMGFKPVLVEGTAIKLNTLLCDGFNADFDGDQMAVFTPVTKEAIEEAKEKMITTQSKDGMDASALSFPKDQITGLFALTMEPKKKIKSYVSIRKESDMTEFDIYKGIKYEGKNTTYGRIVFNKLLPTKYPFMNEPITGKVLKGILAVIFEKYSEVEYRKICDDLQELGSRYYMLASPTFSIDDLDIPIEKFLPLKKKLEGAAPDEAQLIIHEMEIMLSEYLIEKGMSLGMLGEAGALKGGWGQIRQVLIAKGLVADPTGKLLPGVGTSYSEGVSSKQFVEMGAPIRKGIMDRVMNTADTGYLSRQLVYALQSVEVNAQLRDCKTKRHIEITAIPNIAKRLKGRMVLTAKGTYRPFNAKTDTGKVIKLRSPIFCQSKKLCLTCYGQLAIRNGSPYAGITAAQIIGERASQLIMRTFHSGGAVSIDALEITQNIVKYFDEGSKKTFLKRFKQVKNQLIAKEDGVIIVTKSDYIDIKNDITITDDKIVLEYGYLELESNGVQYDITLDYKTEIPILNGIEDETNKITIPFKKGQTVFECSQMHDIGKGAVKVVEALLSGRKAWRDPNHFLLKVFDATVTDSNADLVHFEVLCSNLLRDESNPRIPARLNQKKYNPVVHNIKSIPVYESWLSSLAFENFNKSIETALTYPRPEEETVLERIVTGNL